MLGGAKIYIKREDLLHTGAHKINNCLGQALLARRMGKKRIIAETGAGQHGVASATVCALFGLDGDELAAVPLTAPIFVCGLARSGRVGVASRRVRKSQSGQIDREGGGCLTTRKNVFTSASAAALRSLPLTVRR